MRALLSFLFTYKFQILQYLFCLGVVGVLVFNLHNYSKNNKDKYRLSYLLVIGGIILVIVGLILFLHRIGLVLTKFGFMGIAIGIIAWALCQLLDIYRPIKVRTKNSNKFRLDFLENFMRSKSNKKAKKKESK